MELKEITAAMKAYNAILNDTDSLIGAFKQGSYFEYTLYTTMATSTHVHAYPGIDENGKLLFFMIPSEFDNAGTDHIETYVQPCYMMQVPLGGGNRIPNFEAQAMCNRWLDEFQTWIPDEVTHTEHGLFQAFQIPFEDFEVSGTWVNLALRLDPLATTGRKADVVVTNLTETDVYNDDYAQSVPPFGPSALQSSFYLLSLV